MTWDLTVENEADAAANAAEITRVFCEGDRVLRLPLGRGRVLIDRPFRTLAQSMCGRVIKEDGFGYSADGHPDYAGNIGGVLQLGDCPIGILSGAGFTSKDPVGWYGDNVHAAFEVEGRTGQIATGRHILENQVFDHCGYGLRLMRGYYDQDDADAWVDSEEHADNSIMRNCEFMDSGGGMLCESYQAVNWVFEDIRVGSNEDTATKRPFCMFDMERAVEFWCNRLVINHGYMRIIRVQSWSQHTNDFVVDNIQRDRVMYEDQFCTLFEYAGLDAHKPISMFNLRMNGRFNTQGAPFNYDRLLVNMAGVPRPAEGQWDIAIRGLYKNRVYRGEYTKDPQARNITYTEG